MLLRPRRAKALAGILAAVVLLGAAGQGKKFPQGVISTKNPENNTIALSFDSAGVLNVYVDNQAFGQGTWEAKGDTVIFGPFTAPDPYACSTRGKYLWALADNKMTFTLVGTDDCAGRRDPLIGLTWTWG